MGGRRGMDLPSTKFDDRLALKTPTRMHGLDDLVAVFLQNVFLCAEEIILGRLGRELIVNSEPSLTVQQESREGPLVHRV